MNMTIKLVAYQTPANKPFQCSYEKDLVITVPSFHQALKQKLDIMYYESIGIKEALSKITGVAIKDIKILEWS